MAGVSHAGRVRAVLSVAVGLLSAASAAAQPGSVAPPPGNPFAQVQAQAAPPVLPRSNPLPAPSELPGSAPSPVATLTQPVINDALPPLPGSVEDQYQKELDARRQLQQETWDGLTVTALPNTLLWEPPLAVWKDPRMRATVSDQQNYRQKWSLDTSIGGTQGLWRVDFSGADFATQLDVFGLVQTRLSPEDVLLADYRFGFPVSFKWGWWNAKVGYEHTSAHIGDRLLRAFPGTVIPSFAKDEIVFGLSRYLTEDLRVYGHIAYAAQFVVPDVEATNSTRTRFDIGGEYFKRCATGWTGTPFAAANLEWRGDQGFRPNATVQAGWLWRNPYARLSQMRVFVEHYRGQSPYGQIMQTREHFTSVGVAFDY